MLVTLDICFKQHFDTRYLVFYNPPPPRMFLSLDLLSEYRIQHGAIGPLYVTSSYPTWIFCRGVSGFWTDCPCDVWCHGLTTCLPSCMLVYLLEIDFKHQLGCRFDILHSISSFFVFWHMQLFMSWYIISFFWLYLYFLYILYYFKYSLLTSSKAVVFVLSMSIVQRIQWKPGKNFFEILHCKMKIRYRMDGITLLYNHR